MLPSAEAVSACSVGPSPWMRPSRMVTTQPPSESHEAGGTEPEAMGAPRQHPMAREATARFGGHTVCRWGAGRCHVRVRVSRTLSSCRQPLSYVRGSESAHFHVHPLSCRAPPPERVDLARGHDLADSYFGCLARISSRRFLR